MHTHRIGYYYYYFHITLSLNHKMMAHTKTHMVTVTGIRLSLQRVRHTAHKDRPVLREGQRSLLPQHPAHKLIRRCRAVPNAPTDLPLRWDSASGTPAWVAWGWWTPDRWRSWRSFQRRSASGTKFRCTCTSPSWPDARTIRASEAPVWKQSWEAEPVAIASRHPVRRKPDGPCPDRNRGTRT